MVSDKDIMHQVIFIELQKYLTLKKHHKRTTTIIRTPQYMGPRIIQRKDYGYICRSLECQSLFICIYVCGAVPFAEDLDDPFDIYDEIMKTTEI